MSMHVFMLLPHYPTHQGKLGPGQKESVEVMRWRLPCFQ